MFSEYDTDLSVYFFQSNHSLGNWRAGVRSKVTIYYGKYDVQKQDQVYKLTHSELIDKLNCQLAYALAHSTL